MGSPASPPSSRTHSGLGRSVRTPVRLELKCTSQSVIPRKRLQYTLGKEYSAPRCGPVDHAQFSDARRARLVRIPSAGRSPAWQQSRVRRVQHVTRRASAATGMATKLAGVKGCFTAEIIRNLHAAAQGIIAGAPAPAMVPASVAPALISRAGDAG